MDTIIAFASLLPGFFVYHLLKKILVGYGDNDDNFDKSLISLLYNVPIFCISLIFLKIKTVCSLVFNEEKIINGINIHNIKNIIDINDISILWLIVLFIISSLVFIAIWFIANYIIMRMLGNKEYKIFNYSDIYNDYFVKTQKSIPSEIFKFSTGDILEFGFITEISSSNSRKNIQMVVEEKEIFEELKQEGIIVKDKIYIDLENDLKIQIYKEKEE